jgi:hypothetical protein
MLFQLLPLVIKLPAWQEVQLPSDGALLNPEPGLEEFLMALVVIPPSATKKSR